MPLPVSQKIEVVERLANEYESTISKVSDQFVRFTIQRRFWNSPYDVQLFVDDDRFAFVILGQDRSDGGFIDFGGANRKCRELAEKLRSSIP
jgi:hypothetical protein